MSSTSHPDDPPRRIARHRLARLAGATAIAILGQAAVQMPAGHFGPRDETTLAGWAFVGVAMLGLLVEAIRFRMGHTGLRRSYVPPLLYALNAGVFVPALTTDPLIAGVVILWQLSSLARHLIDRPTTLESSPLIRAYDPGSPPRRWIARYGAALRHLMIVSLVAWIAVIGYGLTEQPLARIVCLSLFAVTTVPLARFVWLVTIHQSRVAALAWLPLAAAALFIGQPAIALSLLAIHQIAVLTLILTHSRTIDELVRHFLEHPSLFVVYTFGALIALGALLLTFPAAANDGVAIAPLDAFFTATSAVCVTGLTVTDTSTAFSRAGQGILLGLFQIGGLGIMVLSAFATVLFGGRLGLRTERALGQQFETASAREVQRLTLFIVVSTLAIELVGAAALYAPFAANGATTGAATWDAVFHSVSAFCNAGFSLRSDSLVGFREDPFTLGVVAALITLGGLGFAVLGTAWRRVRDRRPRRMPLQVRIVLLASAFLVVMGTLLFLWTEWDASLAGLGTGDKVVNAVFQSVTLRTAGFNSVDCTGLRTATLVAMVGWMLIGASPGSTGGGIKTSTIAVVLAVIPALGRSETRVTMFGRTVPQVVVHRAFAIVGITLAVFACGCFLLSLTQTLPLEDLVFEAASAVGTVGLSTGVTPDLDAVGKLVVIGLMFTGRVGPLTLILALGQGAARRCQFPEETVAVG